MPFCIKNTKYEKSGRFSVYFKFLKFFNFITLFLLFLILWNSYFNEIIVGELGYNTFNLVHLIQHLLTYCQFLSFIKAVVAHHCTHMGVSDYRWLVKSNGWFAYTQDLADTCSGLLGILFGWDYAFLRTQVAELSGWLVPKERSTGCQTAASLLLDWPSQQSDWSDSF